MRTIKILEICDRARASAKLFTTEFPGQQYTGDWGVVTWTLDKTSLNLTSEEEDEAWAIYQDTLQITVARLYKLYKFRRL